MKLNWFRWAEYVKQGPYSPGRSLSQCTAKEGIKENLGGKKGD